MKIDPPNLAQLDRNGDFQSMAKELAEIRHHLHQHPELAFEEHRTSDFIADHLQGWGYEVTRGIAKTGLVATLRRGTGLKHLGIRADMDALAITEKNDLPYTSMNIGCMHACGHDGHSTMLLGAARFLVEKGEFSGTLHLIFQPAEERGFESGGKAMVDEGLLERFPCDMIFAMHNHPGAPQGKFLMRTGPFMAAGERVYVRIYGIGGHAARPHLSVDPIVVAAALVMALQTIVSRNVDPTEPAVVTVGRINSGQALNVIPDTAEIGISVRSFSPEVRILLRKRIIELITDTAKAHGARADIQYNEGYPVVNNAPDACRLASEVANVLVGEENVDTHYPQMMGCEDFAYMLQKVPGALIRIGNGPSDCGRGLHSAHYDFNDENLVIGAAFWSRLVEKFLN